MAELVEVPEEEWPICEECGRTIDPAEARRCDGCGTDLHPDTCWDLHQETSCSE